MKMIKPMINFLKTLKDKVFMTDWMRIGTKEPKTVKKMISLNNQGLFLFQIYEHFVKILKDRNTF